MEHYSGRPPYIEGERETEIATYDFLDGLGIPYRTVRHDAAFTMDECAEVEKAIGAPVCKNLFLCNRQQTRFYLLMLPGDKIFKTRFLSAELGCARLSFADESHMTEMLGLHPGAVSPMGLIHERQGNVLPVIDSDLLAYGYIGCHPCVNTATLVLKTSDLLEKVIPATGHSCRIVRLRTDII